jgi:hypothetical protein
MELEASALAALGRKLGALEYEMPAGGIHPSAGPLLEQARGGDACGDGASRGWQRLKQGAQCGNGVCAWR